MSSTPPEVLEKWRKDYLNYLDSRPSSINDLCASDIEAAFIAGRQTAVIELPKPDTTPNENAFVAGKFVATKHLIQLIESQGYRVEVKGD